MRTVSPRGEPDALAAHHFGVADHATVDADVFELQLSVVTSDDRLPLGNQRALQRQHIGPVTTNGDFRLVGFDLLTTTVVNLVKPDFHAGRFLESYTTEFRLRRWLIDVVLEVREACIDSLVFNFFVEIVALVGEPFVIVSQHFD